MMMRRRLDRLGRMAARVAYDAGGLNDAIIVYCSRYGDNALTLSLLEEITAGELPSPAGFSMAVHNSLAGLLSIVASNKRAHTAVAAGPESLGAGLLEAAMIMADQPDRRVMLLYCHEPLAPIYEPFRRLGETSIAVALLLEPVVSADGERLVAKMDGRAAIPPDEFEALSFVRFLLSPDHQAAFFSVGLRWSWGD